MMIQADQVRYGSRTGLAASRAGWRLGCCLALLFVLAASPVWAASATYGPSTVTPPSPMREFRAMWVATVNNIDWPSKPGLSTKQQQILLSGRRNDNEVVQSAPDGSSCSDRLTKPLGQPWIEERGNRL